MHLHGVITALVTPFTEDNAIDTKGLIEAIESQIEAGVSGLVVLGTTGEAPTLTTEERQHIIRTSVKTVAGRIPVIVGTGSNCTRTCVAMSLEAQELGADALLIAMPYYNKPTQEGLVAHIQMVYEATKIPIVLYNIPGRTSVNLEVDTALQLLALDRIVAIKEVSGNYTQVSQLVELSEALNYTVLSGDDAATLPMMALGCHGVISVASNLIPTGMVFLAEALAEQQLHEARVWHYLLADLFEALSLETNPIPIKAALNLIEHPAGHCRLPLTEMTESNQQYLAEIIEDLDTNIAELFEDIETTEANV